MKRSKFPKGWNEERVRKVIAYHEEQTGDEAVAEDEAGVEDSVTVMRVPRDLVPAVRAMIAKRQH